MQKSLHYIVSITTSNNIRKVGIPTRTNCAPFRNLLFVFVLNNEGFIQIPSERDIMEIFFNIDVLALRNPLFRDQLYLV